MKILRKASVLAVTMALATTVNASSNEMTQFVDSKTERLQEIYKDLHANPELGFMEYRTAGVVADELTKLGFEVKTGIGKTGVVGILENGPGPVVMFRADMDANAVKEETGLPYASNVKVTNLDGEETYVSHMCGHDAHTTWLIGLAKVMAEMKSEWQGTLVLVAQPAEEPIEGAQSMVQDGMYTTHGVPEPDYFIAMHTFPFATGTVLASPGRVSTGSDHIDVTFHGVGGHGSSPHLAKDPVLMAGQAIVQLQTVVSRHIDPTDVSVLTVGSVQAGVDNNVIPEEATLKLKLHFSDNEVRKQMHESITNIVNNIARSNGMTEEDLPTITYKGFAAAMVNDPELTSLIQQELRDADYVNKVMPQFQAPASDDATTLVDHIPGVKVSYLAVGSAEPKLVEQAHKNGQHFPFMNHNPDYQVDLDAIGKGTKVASDIILKIMEK
ncbi:amidohydrolase [Vibrio parahaemolyticus]|uniref:amidohydrolase n=1 Tax=Vibrio parahaemolyticus TaxID=670 RepID=UPI001B82F862|nr:amidohydrolase [Vibrio parahaemolyticus]EJE4168355.1 amidohydrolase [Vibrio parahaemolyticus]MCI9705964.1 amidohydrolase [Vibrio parahaemolyticus]MDF5483663.1 amidohydrolase [Vibrio parahaemolyticus]MDG2839254.1 amidohydrolase [Vibrio parahaemolyticus]HBC3357482.1 amidohydrolase [Vibrio parahaemolyticus]